MSSASSKQVQQKKINRNKTTEISDPMTWTVDQMRFDPVITSKVPNSEPEITFWRVPIYTVNDNKTEGELIMSLEECFSFGVSANKDPTSGALNGYSAAVSMWDRDGASPQQVKATDTITALVERCKDHLLSDEVMSAVDKFDKNGLERSDLKKLDPLYWTMERGKKVDGKGPTFYPKLIWYKGGKNKKGEDTPARMETIFYSGTEVDEHGDPAEINPLDFLGQRFHIKPLVKFESIYIGAKITLQCKVYEASTREAEGGKKRLLHVPSGNRPTVTVSGANPLTRQAKTKIEIDVKVSDNTDKKDDKSLKASPKGPKSGKLLESDDEGDDDGDKKEEKKVEKGEKAKKKVEKPEKPKKKIVSDDEDDSVDDSSVVDKVEKIEKIEKMKLIDNSVSDDEDDEPAVKPIKKAVPKKVQIKKA